MVIGAGAVAGPTGIWVLVMQLTGTASTMMGDTAEQWTAQELRPLSKDGWRLINHFGLTGDDIDHLLVGPGGVFVLETKWSSMDWQSAAGRERQRRAATQAAANARRLNLWAPFKKSGLHAQPVVVLWGADVRELTHDSKSPFGDIDGTPVLLGPTLQDWVRARHRTPVSRDGIDAVWPALLAQVSRRDANEKETNPLPPSAVDLASRVIFSLIAALTSAVVIGQVLRWTQSVLATSLVGLTLGAAGAVVARWRPAKWIGWSWTAGTALTLAGLLIAIISLNLSHPT
jgi:hypothetical protein